jgi:hypothetical protein
MSSIANRQFIQTKYLFSFLFCKIGEQKGRVGPAQWEGEVTGKGGRRVNTVQKMHAHVCKRKNDTCLNCSMNQKEESSRNRKFKFDEV